MPVAEKTTGRNALLAAKKKASCRSLEALKKIKKTILTGEKYKIEKEATPRVISGNVRAACSERSVHRRAAEEEQLSDQPHARSLRSAW